ncbi:unnamed protein product [Paramecium pentaurelia]|uniref:Transmembrane protein n=1 Tax=Paramecium pentaurelia TaxID=43138 RepID=A0A8S1T7M0_9CILI|nr:unnamed protein product [Paramecium pentaurelia]
MNNLIQKLSHQSLPFKISDEFATIIIAIKYFQVLAIIQPTYDRIHEPSLLFTTNILKSILIIPYASNFTLILLCLILLVIKELTLATFCIIENSTSKIVNKYGLKLIFYEILFFQQTTAIPELYLLIGLLNQNNKKVAFQSFKFAYVAPICIFVIIIVTIIAFFRVYFLRAQNIISDTKIFPKFTYFTILRFFLKICIIIISFESSYAANLLKLCLGFGVFIVCLIELYIETTFEPSINRQLTIIISCLKLTTFVQLICYLFSPNKEDQMQSFYILFGIPIIFIITRIINQRKKLDILIYQSYKYPIIIQIEELYEFMSRLNSNKPSIELIIQQFQIYSRHSEHCKSCNTEYNYSIPKLIQCLIQNKFRKNKKSKDSENLMILYVNFLSNTMHQPLVAYVEVKKFEFRKKRFSIYYKFIRNQFALKLKEKIEDKQSHSTVKSNLTFSQQIEIKEIIQSFHLEDEYLKKYILLLNQKIKIWQLQIKGVENIGELIQVVSHYGQMLQKVMDQFFQDFHQSLNLKKCEQKNAIHLKLMSILYSLILNNTEQAQVYEQQIVTICANESNLPLDTICNASLLDDKVCLLTISMVKNKGKILNANKKQLAKHFGFSCDDYHLISHINDLMPPFLIDVHNHLLELYLESAQSQLFRQFIQITTVQQDGLLQAKQLKLDNNFSYEDDYVITGCISKVKEGSEFIIFDSSGKILSATESIYHIMIQGIDQEATHAIQTLNQCYIFFFFPEILKIFAHHKITNKSYHNLEIEDQTTLITRFNISDFIIKYQKLYSSTSPYKYLQFEHRGSQHFQKSKTSGIQSECQSSFNKTIPKATSKPELQILTITYQKQIEDIMKKINEGGEATYSIKFILTYKVVGPESLHKSFFLMEIIDFRSKEQLLSKRRKVSVMKLHQNYIPNTSSRFKLDSFRDDSKRLDQSSEQFIQSFAQIHHQDDLLDHDHYSYKQKDFSVDENQQSEGSKTSLDSSKSNTNKECHIFINSKKIIKPLKVVIALSSLIMIVKLIYLIASLIIIQDSTNQIVQSNKNINAPLIFNRQFFQFFSLQWILLLQKLQIIDCSTYLLNQTDYKLTNISESTFQELNKLYSSFIEVEDSGLLENINYRSVGEDRQIVGYTYFILNLERTIKELFYFNKDFQIEYHHITTLMTLRINLYNVYYMSKTLISSYEELYGNTLDNQSLKIVVITFTIIIVLLFKIIIQFFFWKQCSIYQRQLIFMIGRLKEKEARQQILKSQQIKEILENKENIFNWRQINYSSYDFNNNQNNDIRSQRGSQQTTKIQNRQPIVLNTRIQDTSMNRKIIILILFLTYITFIVYIICGYILFRKEIQQMIPFQKMTLQFITFSTNLDAMIGSGMIIKSLPSIYDKLTQQSIITQEMIEKLQDANNQLFQLFEESEVNFDANLISIFEQITLSKQISDADKNTLESIYKYDICLKLLDDVPFCKYPEVNQTFINLYSNPNQVDDISNFYENGIKGIASQISSIIKQYFDYEISQQRYLFDVVGNEQFMNSKEFNTAFLQHFLFTTKTIDIFINIIQYSNQHFAEDNLITIQLYYCITGSIIILLYMIVYTKWIQINYFQFRFLKFGLSLLPSTIQNDPYIMNSIKQLS